MRRRMVITVVNTGIEEKWELSKSHLDHGKWMDGSPPAYVGQNGTANVRSEKQTGASYGTTGWITFTSSVKPGGTLRISWNKPYGGDATTCVAEMTSLYYSAAVENKDFQTSDAACDVVISVKTK
jgi:hypothetical protein